MATPLSAALADLAILNTSLPFQALHKGLYPLTRSLPMILHHRFRITQVLLVTLCNAADSVNLALSAYHTIDLIPAFIQSLSPDPDFQLLDINAILSPLMQSLVAIATHPPSVTVDRNGDRGNDPNSPTEISKRAFQVLAWTLREIGGDLLNGNDCVKRGEIAWHWFKIGLEENKSKERIAASTNNSDLLSEEEEADLLEPEEPEAHHEIQDDVEGGQRELQIELESDLNEALTHEQDEAFQDEEQQDNDNLDEDFREEGSSSKRSKRPASRTLPHARRFLATCFAFLVRKSRPGPALDALVRTILESFPSPSARECRSEPFAESIAWIVVESIKSVETHIHSRGPAIFRTFIRHAVRLQCSPTVNVLEAALTALIHSSRKETFHGMVDVLLAEFESITDEEVSNYHSLLIMRLMGALVGTRKGSRLSEEAKIHLFASCEKLSADVLAQADASMTTNNENVSNFVKLATKILLIAPNLETMLGTGRKLLAKIWQLPASVCNIYATRWAFC